jgi:plastocyanin
VILSKSIKNIIVIVVAAAVILTWFMTDPAILSRATVPEPTSDRGTATTATTTTNTVNAQGRVAVGGGNLTLSINQFSPSVIDIQSGENVTFYAPSGSTEIHNVIFDFSNATAISDIALPFILPPGISSKELQLAPPNNIGEPVNQNTSDGRQEIIALNKVAFHPSVVNQNGNVSYLQEQEFMQQIEQARLQGLYMPLLSANYTMQGTEKMVSSGLILDLMGFGIPEPGGGGGDTVPAQSTSGNSTNAEAGLPPPPAYPILSNFTMTFETPGEYPFFCAFHPGMAGVVNVIDTNAALGQP